MSLVIGHWSLVIGKTDLLVVTKDKGQTTEKYVKLG